MLIFVRLPTAIVRALQDDVARICEGPNGLVFYMGHLACDYRADSNTETQQEKQ